MGWWFRSGPPLSALKSVDSVDSLESLPSSAQPSPSDPDYHTPMNPTPTSAESMGPSTLQTSLEPLSRDQQAEQDLKHLIAEFSQTQSSPSSSQQPTPSKTIVGHDHESNTPPVSYSDSIYPTTMSCRQAFDLAFHCQSLGGQFNNVYRYGTIRSCSDHWSQFWFCMRMRSYPTPERESMIRDFYKEKVGKYTRGPSSEEIWRPRTEPLKDPFQGDPNAAEE